MPVKRAARAAKKSVLPWAAALAAIAGLAAIWFTVLKPADVPTARATVPSIAVLPFDDMSPEKNLAYMGDGVAEDIISMLARSPDVIGDRAQFVLHLQGQGHRRAADR